VAPDLKEGKKVTGSAELQGRRIRDFDKGVMIFERIAL
jgi:hypothetical protein